MRRQDEGKKHLLEKDAEKGRIGALGCGQKESTNRTETKIVVVHDDE